MKKILVAFFIAFLCCACAKGNDMDKYVDDLLKDEKMLSKEVVKNYCNFKSSKLIDDKTKGVLAVSVDDFDDDGEDDVIVARVDDGGVVLSLYALEDEKLVEQDSMLVIEDYLTIGSIVRIDGFVKEVKGEKSFFIEGFAVNSFFADGMSWKFVKVGVSNGKLTSVYKNGIDGSYFEEEEIEKIITNLVASGLDVDNIVLNDGDFIVEQDKDVDKVFTIERDVFEGFDVEAYEKEKEDVQYGETNFIDYTE